MINKVYNYLINLGAHDLTNDFDRLTKVLNILSVVSIGIITIALSLNLAIGNDPFYTVNLIAASILFGSILFSNGFGKVILSRCLFSLLSPVIIGSIILFIGGNFSQSIATGAIVSISCLLFKSKVKFRNFIVIFNLFCYLIPTVYITQNGPLLGIHDIAYDEIFILFGCIVWIVIVFNIYEAKFRDYMKILKKKNESLQEKTSELTRFNYVASHDLKSPLTNVINFVGLVRNDLNNKNYERLPDYMNFIESSAHRMNELIEGVLEVSQINHRVEHARDKICLNGVLENVINSLAFEIKSKNVKIKRAKLPFFIGSKFDFVTLFQNLLQNAIKYNRSEEIKIEINFEEKLEKIFIKVKDNGIGIPKKYSEEIFEYFKRLHNHDEIPGTGLGLGLCKKIMHKYDGQISVDSIVGSYTEFTLEFPKEAVLFGECEINLIEDKFEHAIGLN